ncbi:hypothetical protein Ddye_002707 [Dipteronia dyeriana]|uniref:SnoaL-like domain-containing protein n=1 Tax=Dipteronia dyeriana TaxID=168575 RepID=A0AAD9XS73_9ROSI|nr:hypothetical protein Ddye_002707 [Dipteronia dyeriana]
MASAINFSGQALRQNMCFRATGGKSLHSLPMKRSCHHQLKQNQMNIQQNWPMQGQGKNKSFVENKRHLIVSAINRLDIESSPFSASDLIRQFYACINEKNLKKLDNYISDDCYIEDCSFPNPLQGKKEVMWFFKQLTISMGQNVKFSIEHVCEGGEFTAGVNWHLEWKQTQIPFTRGCSFYECSIEREALKIKKALVVIESPIKPGDIVLTLLKNLVSLFDDFPKATEWFLKSPNVILQCCLNIYMKLLAHFISPLLAGYIRIANFMACILGVALNVLYQILKIIFK